MLRVAFTPVAPSPHSSPASRPALSSECTYSPAKVIDGCRMTARREWVPILPVAHWTTRYGLEFIRSVHRSGMPASVRQFCFYENIVIALMLGDAVGAEVPDLVGGEGGGLVVGRLAELGIEHDGLHDQRGQPPGRAACL